MWQIERRRVLIPCISIQSLGLVLGELKCHRRLRVLLLCALDSRGVGGAFEPLALGVVHWPLCFKAESCAVSGGVLRTYAREYENALDVVRSEMHNRIGTCLSTCPDVCNRLFADSGGGQASLFRGTLSGGHLQTLPWQFDGIRTKTTVARPCRTSVLEVKSAIARLARTAARTMSHSHAFNQSGEGASACCCLKSLRTG